MGTDTSDPEPDPHAGRGDGHPPDPTVDDPAAALDDDAAGSAAVPIDLRHADGDATDEDGWTPPSWLGHFGASGKAWWVLAGVAALVLAGLVGSMISKRVSAPSTNSVDVGFLADMSDHHDQAVDMALLEIANGQDTVAKDFATEVVLFQRYELGIMAHMLDERHSARPDFSLDRPTMKWMGMATPLREMPGYAAQDQLEKLKTLRGTEGDLLFLTLMREHHRGGLHMADYAREHARSSDIRELAGIMARNQRAEINEYTTAIERLGMGG